MRATYGFRGDRSGNFQLIPAIRQRAVARFNPLRGDLPLLALMTRGVCSLVGFRDHKM